MVSCPLSNLLNSPSLTHRLQPDHMGINTASIHQLFWRSLFCGYTVRKYDHLICTADGTHTVCDHKYGLIFYEP